MSGRKFTMVSPKIWQSSGLSGLKTSCAQVLFLYYFTSQHQNSAGCYRIPDVYVWEDFGWDAEAVRNSRQELIRANLVEFEE